MKKILSAILAVMLLVGSLAIPSAAALPFVIDSETKAVDYKATVNQYLSTNNLFEKESDKLAKMTLSYEKDGYQLWVDELTGEVATVNVATGKITYHQKGSAYQSEWFNPKMPIEGSFASGGTPNMGSLFLAGEAGPEFVGNVGGQTQVYNEDQLANTLSASNEGLINTILAAANALIGAIEDKDLNVSIGDRDIAESARRGARLNGRAMVV